MNNLSMQTSPVTGEFVDFQGERMYAVRNMDKMPPFFVSVVSNADHWMFISSSGGLTAGRVSPESALFPYTTVDRIHDGATHTGCLTAFHVMQGDQSSYWEPFNHHHAGRFRLSRTLYKNCLGNKICFEETNHDLEISFRYVWSTSEAYGFVRECQLENSGDNNATIEVLDGLRNLLPAGTPAATQTNASNLVDAYKWTELDPKTGLALYTLYSQITDRAEPAESLKANTVFCLGLSDPCVLLSSTQVRQFQAQLPLQPETQVRGIRGAYLVNTKLNLRAGTTQQWQFVANVEQSQAQVVDLSHQLSQPAELEAAVAKSIQQGSDGLARIMAAADGFQLVAEENVAIHHYANVLFNVLRGGIINDQYRVDAADFQATIRSFNHKVFETHQDFLSQLSGTLDFSELLALVSRRADPQLERLTREYLPITFGRRHGDPSRPWNQFAIQLKDELGNRLLSYQGNWRDIFQNWEALLLSFPSFTENVIAKFVNASTVDGYNPYRITKQGIDWEVEESDNPWSYIGYWGDHQIIYLQKLLELSDQFHPRELRGLLRKPIFSYANVPYRIRPFDQLLASPKDTVVYDHQLAEQIESRLTTLGADGKLLLNGQGQVFTANLLEKLLVPLLSKLSNLVIGGGIWLNTQRPEWNDANNALVGQGISMVTLYYLRRYIRFLQALLQDETAPFELATEVAGWLAETAAGIANMKRQTRSGEIDDTQRLALLSELGEAACRYRTQVYEHGLSTKTDQDLSEVMALLNDALAVVDYSIRGNEGTDGLYHAYNVLSVEGDRAKISRLYPMLEGQVAILSSGGVTPSQAVTIVESLFQSEIYRPDQQSFMLYPDRDLPGFLEKNQIPEKQVHAIPLLVHMLESGDSRIVVRDAGGCYRFSAEFSNAADLNEQLDRLQPQFGNELKQARKPIQALFESVFNHSQFTGRSGTMFGFEGLGSIYWHMVAKLLLAIQENYFRAQEDQHDPESCRKLADLYYRVRAGIGFNKSPAEYGAFPTDPYSHTPKHAGARQPGMTGQVKEELLTRFGELGIRVRGGQVRFNPSLLRAREFMGTAAEFCYLDVDDHWQEVTVPASALAFTWCQVPCTYEICDTKTPSLTVTLEDGQRLGHPELVLNKHLSAELFSRSGRIRHIHASMQSESLFPE